MKVFANALEDLVKNNFETKTANPYFESVFDVAPVEVERLRSEVVLIDVREPEEFTGELGHIPGSKLIPLGSLPGQLSALPMDKTVVFICRSGNRSAQASAFAASKGLDNTYNMLGGMILWNSLLLPVERN